MKNITLGIVAHVDSGKTTLTEAILYKTGIIKKCGRVDNRDSYLDNNPIERQRGITVFFKQADFALDNTCISMLDTPGHVDFAPEMERTLSVLDYAILIISAPEGIRPHTMTLWKLLNAYNIPVFIFVNKMDQPGADKESIINLVKEKLSQGCIDFSDSQFSTESMEDMAILSSDTTYNHIFNHFLERNILDSEEIRLLIHQRIVFPVFFGSALKLEGIDRLLQCLDEFTLQKSHDNEAFGGIVFKISRDNQGNRLSHIKITRGALKIKDVIGDEKVNQIRIYSGDKFKTTDFVSQGNICTVPGLEKTKAGMGLGVEKGNPDYLIMPVMTYELICPVNINNRKVYLDLKNIEEEYPELSVEWNEENQSISLMLMGEIQIEIIREIIKNRLGFTPEFSVGKITYKETLEDAALGVGHFEPLRHYAEVQLNITPGERGSGITISSQCSEDVLGRNWQRLIATHLKEKKHRGVLIGAELTDVNITIVGGRAHSKHTEGGDFRHATYRAVRNGLMYGKSVILEPYYDFTLTIPSDMVGRAMTDLDNMYAKTDAPVTEDGKSIIKGRAPVATLNNYQLKLNAYTHGEGSLSFSFCGYDKCHNEEQIISQTRYDPEMDVDNPSSSVFCSHGAGVIIPWYRVREYMHCENPLVQEYKTENSMLQSHKGEKFDYSIDLEEIDEILSRTYNANLKTEKSGYKKKKSLDCYYKPKNGDAPKERIIVADGYNMIFADKVLSELALLNINSAKDKLIDMLSNYTSIISDKIILVFDGYKVKDNKGSTKLIGDLTLIYTKEGETADQYIEAFTQKNMDKYKITVITSDNLIQQVTRGHNCSILSSREFFQVMENEFNKLRDTYNL